MKALRTHIIIQPSMRCATHGRHVYEENICLHNQDRNFFKIKLFRALARTYNTLRVACLLAAKNNSKRQLNGRYRLSSNCYFCPLHHKQMITTFLFAIMINYHHLRESSHNIRLFISQKAFFDISATPKQTRIAGHYRSRTS